MNCSSGRARSAEERRPCWNVRCAACSRTRASQRAGRELRRPVAATAEPAGVGSRPERVPRLRRQPAAGVPARDRAARSRASFARTATSLDLLTADYTFVNERLASHYGMPNVYGSQFRRVTLTDEARKGLLGKGSDPDGHVAPRPDVARRARQMDSRQPAGHAAAAAAARRAAARREPRRQRRARCASRWRRTARTRRAPAATAHGPARLRPGELRRGRRMARRATPALPIDASGQLTDGTHVDGVVTLRQALAEAARGVRQHVDREAADLRAWAAGSSTTTCRRSARIVREAGRETIGFRRCSGIVRARRFR